MWSKGGQEVRTCPDPTCQKSFVEIDEFVFHMNDHYRVQMSASIKQSLMDILTEMSARQAKQEQAWRLAHLAAALYPDDDVTYGTMVESALKVYKLSLKTVMETEGM